MKILSASQIRELDAYTIKHEPIKSIDLMERAAQECFQWIINKYSKQHSFKIFCGLGNNSGDGLVIARLLLSSNVSTGGTGKVNIDSGRVIVSSTVICCANGSSNTRKLW